MADESKYLEENYDGDAEQRDAQRAEDIENAKKNGTGSRGSAAEGI